MKHSDRVPAPGDAALPRRDFLKAAGALGMGTAASVLGAAPPRQEERRDAEKGGDKDAGHGDIPRRAFGKSGVKVSALGLGGHHLGDFKTVEEAIKVAHEAIDGGITFFDNCWEYHNGKSEDFMGRALRGKRDKVFLMTKVCTHGRGKDLARRMLNQSLRRLQTDHLDLWQIHGVSFDNDPELAYARGGVLEALDEAKRAGKVRFVGFTGHKDPAIHLHMVKLGYPFDSVQMPLNPLDSTFRSFEQQVLPELNKRGIAAIGMKPIGGGDAVKRGQLKAEEMLRYAMSLPVAVTITGIDSAEILRQALKIAQGFKPYTDEEMQEVRKHFAAVAADGRFETYKVSLRYDNPQARMPHHFPFDPTQKEIQDMFEEVMGEKPT
jgi:aryl-alcohol dehydrogenase-like predicted oxidoreductase